jgi:hypothetical protein
MNLLWDKAIAAGRLFGIEHRGRWLHVGTPEAIRWPKRPSGNEPWVLMPRGCSPSRRTGPFSRISPAPCLRAFPALTRWPPPAGSIWRLDDPASHPPRRARDRGHFFRLKGSSGLLLPRIKPIGDIDEDLLAFDDQGGADDRTPVTAGPDAAADRPDRRMGPAHPQRGSHRRSPQRRIRPMALPVAGRIPRFDRDRGTRPGQDPRALWHRIRAPPRGHSRVPGHRAREISPAPDGTGRLARRRGAR